MLDLQVDNHPRNVVDEGPGQLDPGGVPGQETIKEIMPELMAPGHPYNPRTGTGIEWLPMSAESKGGEPGLVRLWSRGWNGQPLVLAEAEHRTGTAWEYWYNLVFADCFPQVTHWWFGDAWTGPVRIWSPDSAGRDPESGEPTLMGWMRFGHTGVPDDFAVTISEEPAASLPSGAGGATALPWTVVLTNPVRVNTPLPPFSTSVANLPFQLLLAESVIGLLGRLGDRMLYRGPSGTLAAARPDEDMVLTSLVRREDLERAFPTEFGPWRLDKLPDLTPREALCRVLGLQPPQ